MENTTLVPRLRELLLEWKITLDPSPTPDEYLLTLQQSGEKAVAVLPAGPLSRYAKRDGGDGLSLLAVHIFEAFTVDSPPLKRLRLKGSLNVRLLEERES